jgi:NAD(P)-dependent dehydrogenase (short-subunit alcohol dehydrogenase family)
MADINGRNAIVTGAAQGLGRAVALRLLAEGAVVVGVDIQGDKLATLRSSLQSGAERFHVCSGDLSKSKTAEAAVATAIAAAGGIDIVVNCAGGSGSRGVADIEDLDEALWDSVIGANLRATFLQCRAAVPHLRRSRNGRIVNFSSSLTQGVSGPLGTVGARLAYCAAKGGIEAFSRQLARDLLPHRITVNTVAPRLILTEPGARVRDRYDQLDAVTQARMLAGRQPESMGKPDDVADTVAYLVSDKASQVTGAMIAVGN